MTWSRLLILLGLRVFRYVVNSHFPDYQRWRWIDAHLKICSGLTHCKITSFQFTHRNNGGWQNLHWRKVRVEQAAAKGHDIHYIGEDRIGMQRNEKRIRSNLPALGRFTNCSTFFTTGKCVPNKFPKGSH